MKKAKRNILIIIAILLIALLTTFLLQDKKEAVSTECVPKEVGFKLFLDCEDMYRYTSEAGVSTLVRIDPRGAIVVTATDTTYKNKATYQLWGGSEQESHAIHENLNGKHIKDTLHRNRTILFSSGVKVTLVSSELGSPVETVSIYDGAIAHRINILQDKVEYSAEDAMVANNMDKAEIDGETATYKPTETGLIFYNVYTEDEQGQKTEEYTELGELFEDRPRKVDDLYDDTRLSHT